MLPICCPTAPAIVCPTLGAAYRLDDCCGWLNCAPCADDAEQQCGREDLIEVLVYVRAKTGVPSLVGPRHAEEVDTRAVGIEQPRPRNKNAALALYDAVIVGADESRAPRNKEIAPDHAVEDVVAHLRDDRAGKICVDSG